MSPIFIFVIMMFPTSSYGYSFNDCFYSKAENKLMKDIVKKIDKSTWAVGGGVLLGLGVGFFFLDQSALYFIGSILCGLGLGLFATAIISKEK